MRYVGKSETGGAVYRKAYRTVEMIQVRGRGVTIQNNEGNPPWRWIDAFGFQLEGFPDKESCIKDAKKNANRRD